MTGRTPKSLLFWFGSEQADQPLGEGAGERRDGEPGGMPRYVRLDEVHEHRYEPAAGRETDQFLPGPRDAEECPRDDHDRMPGVVEPLVDHRQKSLTGPQRERLTDDEPTTREGSSRPLAGVNITPKSFGFRPSSNKYVESEV